MSAIGPAGRASLMAHLVAYYPDRESSFHTALGLVDAGVDFLEIQFPFSDPTADGPAIQEACATALETGFTMAGGFQLVGELAQRTDRPIMLMSYAGPVFARGVARFVSEAAERGVAGLIVPDLPLDPQYNEGLFEAARGAGIEAVPVVVAGAPEERVRLVLEWEARYVYVALRRGTTGDQTTLTPEAVAFLDRIRSAGVYTFAGFGVSSREQVEQLGAHADSVVVGSAFVRTVHARKEYGPAQVRNGVYHLAAELVGGPRGPASRNGRRRRGRSRSGLGRL